MKVRGGKEKEKMGVKVCPGHKSVSPSRADVKTLVVLSPSPHSGYVCGLQAELSSVSSGPPLSRFPVANSLKLNVRLVVLQGPLWTSSSFP